MFRVKVEKPQADRAVPCHNLFRVDFSGDDNDLLRIANHAISLIEQLFILTHPESADPAVKILCIFTQGRRKL